jgi:hypothetical protein
MRIDDNDLLRIEDVNIDFDEDLFTIKTNKDEYITVPQINSLWRDWEAFIACIIGDSFCIKREADREKIKKLGLGSPKQLHRVFRAKLSEKYLDSIANYVRKLCITPKYISKIEKVSYNIDWNLVIKVYKCKPLLDQLVEDGIFNLSPIVLLFGLPPKELKEKLGKAVWKRVANNSFTRNKLIANSSNMFKAPEYIIDKLSRVSLLPSTLLNTIDPPYHDKELSTLSSIWKNSRRPYKDLKVQHIRYYYDVIFMATQLGKSPKPKVWDDVVKLHDRYVEEINKKKIEKMNKNPPPNVCIVPPTEFDGFKITPLLTEVDYHMEGVKMHHCIKSYYGRYKEGRYYTFHIEHIESGEISTLGIYNFPGIDTSSLDDTTSYIPSWGVDQHCGVCNESPKNNRQIEEYVLQLYRTYRKRKL